MQLNPNIPRFLRLTAWLFLGQGISALLGTLISIFKIELRLDWGIIFIFAGLGLLRLSNAWRWFSVIALLVESALILWMVPISFRVGKFLGEAKLAGFIPIHSSNYVLSSILLGVFILYVVQIVYLIIPKTRELFHSDSHA